MALAEYLQCGICFEPYTASSRLPKFLQCGGGIQHTYCLQCLRRLTVGGMIKCPCCGDLTSLAGKAADSLKNNIYLLPQIEAAAAAAAQARNGLEMFCQTCTAVATERCGEHQLLRMSELRDAVRRLAEKGAASMERVRQRRAEVVAVLREARGVLASVAESVQHTIDDYEMDVQLDDSIVSELERQREAAESLPSDQLVASYRLVEQHAADAAAALCDTAAAGQSRALLAAAVTVASEGGGLQQEFPVGEWLHSGDLMKALLAASVVVFSLDHVTAEAADGAAGGEAAEANCKTVVDADKITKSSGIKPQKALGNGDICNSKPPGKSIASSSDKAGGKPCNSASEVPVTKTSAAAANGKGSPSSLTTNGSNTGKVNAPSKSSKAGTASEKTTKIPAAEKESKTRTPESARKTASTTTAAATKTTVSKAAPSFSTMVKSSAAPAPPLVAQRPVRPAHPLYCLRVTNGTNATDVIVELRPDMAPIMCKNFIKLCEGGHFDNSKFHFAVHSDYLLGGRVDDDEGFSPLAAPPNKFVMADRCPLQDTCGAIRMKGMGTAEGPDGEKRGVIGSQFMMWVSETREYRQYHYTLVFGFIRQGLEFIRAITMLERPTIWRNARLLSTKPYQQ